MNYTHLTYEQRYHIDVGRRRDLSCAVIGRQIGVDRGTVDRELKRGSDPDGRYRAAGADERARARARSSAANHPTKPQGLWQLIAQWIGEQCSPEQAAGRLGKVGLALSVSVPAIYAFVRRDERACGDLYTHLRRAHKRRLCRSPAGGMPRNRPSIRHRPRIIQERHQSGHWEADTMRGSHGHPQCVLAAVERVSRYTRLAVLSEPTAKLTARTLSEVLASFKVRSITFDNGTEFAQYAKACEQLKAQAYFAEPARPQQRGTCENTIGLIRQYLPKYTSLAKLSADTLQWIEHQLNHRPRKCLGFLTPHEVLFNLKPTPVALRT
jgi:IS30 family transposase